MENQHEGPTMRTIPAQVYNTCSGCKWLTHKLVRSGKIPIYENRCTHLIWETEYAKRGVIITTIENHQIHTPAWCPIAGDPIILLVGKGEELDSTPGTGEMFDGDY